MKNRKTNVLVIGSGGREHAIIWKLAQSPRIGRIFVAPGNGGTTQIAQNIEIEPTDFLKLIKFAKDNKVDLTIVGPDDLLALGIVDRFRKAGLKIFGPNKKAARIESSKAFSKNLMKKMKIPTAKYQIFDDYGKALKYVGSQNFPIVIKVNGLALGKGVLICKTIKEAKESLKNIMIDKTFGDSGNLVVIEEFLGSGQEISIHCITDGKDILIFPTAQDHKPIYNGDKGPNTGGMGTYVPIPWARKDYLDWATETVIKPILKGLVKTKSKFSGLLYPGLKLTDSGPKVLEFNARFGDPETQSYMRLLNSDLLDIFEGCTDGQLGKIKPKWKTGFAVCVIIASKGYPLHRGKDVPIKGIIEAEKIPNIVIFHSGTTVKDNKILASGGRVLGVTATGKTLEKAVKTAYKAVAKIKFEGMQFRNDIAAKAFTKRHFK